MECKVILESFFVNLIKMYKSINGGGFILNIQLKGGVWYF